MEYEFLYHHGIKGMKWGVRRYQNKDGSLTPAGKKRKRSAMEEARTLSDEELRSRINRMNAEKQYVNLVNERNVSSGQRRVKQLLKTMGSVATATSTALTLYSNSERIINLVEKKLRES